jgi:hypothetical protein
MLGNVRHLHGDNNAKFIFSPMAQESLVGQDLLIFEALRSHSDTPHSVGLFSTSDQSARDLYLTTQNTQKRGLPMPQWDSNPPTYAIDRAANGICQRSYTTSKLMELDPSVSKNSILDVCRPTTTYISKKTTKNK